MICFIGFAIGLLQKCKNFSGLGKGDGKKMKLRKDQDGIPFGTAVGHGISSFSEMQVPTSA
jgi:hypothetical protein